VLTHGTVEGECSDDVIGRVWEVVVSRVYSFRVLSSLNPGGQPCRAHTQALDAAALLGPQGRHNLHGAYLSIGKALCRERCKTWHVRTPCLDDDSSALLVFFELTHKTLCKICLGVFKCSLPRSLPCFTILFSFFAKHFRPGQRPTDPRFVRLSPQGIHVPMNNSLGPMFVCQR
jgi:hypothetical protein